MVFFLCLLLIQSISFVFLLNSIDNAKKITIIPQQKREKTLKAVNKAVQLVFIGAFEAFALIFHIKNNLRIVLGKRFGF